MEKQDYSYIIDEVCRGKKTPDIVRRALPILIGWAKQPSDKLRTYDDLTRQLGYKSSFSGIGYPLGAIKEVLDRLGKETGEQIPCPNGLICSKKTSMPSEGFNCVIRFWNELTLEEQREQLDLLNNKVTSYKKWDWVLASLGLKTASFDDYEEDIQGGKYYGGGEGKEHKALKEYITSNPQIVGLRKGTLAKTEHILNSGDRLDVYFPNEKIAVEVKPSNAPDSDVFRGIFQCVKYKAVMEAESAIHGEFPNSKAILVIGGKLSVNNRICADDLSVTVIENVRVK